MNDNTKASGASNHSSSQMNSTTAKSKESSTKTKNVKNLKLPIMQNGGKFPPIPSAPEINVCLEKDKINNSLKKRQNLKTKEKIEDFNESQNGCLKSKVDKNFSFDKKSLNENGFLKKDKDVRILSSSSSSSSSKRAGEENVFFKDMDLPVGSHLGPHLYGLVRMDSGDTGRCEGVWSLDSDSSHSDRSLDNNTDPEHSLTGTNQELGEY